MGDICLKDGSGIMNKIMCQQLRIVHIKVYETEECVSEGSVQISVHVIGPFQKKSKNNYGRKSKMNRRKEKTIVALRNRLISSLLMERTHKIIIILFDFGTQYFYS